MLDSEDINILSGEVGANNIHDLNMPQLEAVKHTQGPLLILAGAGTGKTKVLTNRIAYIIQQGLAFPSNILAVTFTNKAAREMQERIKTMISADGLNIGTFHSIATRMLRAHIELLQMGLDKNFTIIDQDEQIKLIKNLCAEENIDTKTYAPKALHSIISRWKDQALFPEKITASDCSSFVYTMAKKIYGPYQRHMQDSNAVDFGDLLLYCNKLLIDNPHILEHYQNKFKYIMIDEYQDTNAVQYIWVRMLAQKYKNLCCVGDDDQSIYSWRGAEVKNILRFEKDFNNAKIIKLEQNYRSSPIILQAASAIISQNKQRHSKKLWTQRQEGELIKIVSCWSDREEARWVVSEVERCLNENKYNANSIAILVRAGFQTRSFEEAFISNAIPYQIIGGLRFYERMEIRDLLAYIRLSINHNDNLAFERIINVPKRSIGSVTLGKIKEYALAHNCSLFDALAQMLEIGELKGKTQEVLQQFVKLLRHANNEYKTKPAFEVSKYLLEASGYLASIKLDKNDDARGRVENLNEMLKAIGEFDNIIEFIEHSSLVMDNESLESDFGGAVKVMTLHAAKGLEFDLVFLPGWEENIFPHQKAIMEEGEKGLEEERRIAYVGITRAKKELFITYTESRRMYNEFIQSVPSRFLQDIPEALCKKLTSNHGLNYIGAKHSFSMQNVKTNNFPSRNSFGAPAASLSRSHTQTHQAPQKNTKAGAKVKHVKFGQGVLLRQNGDNLEIAFQQFGVKTIKANFIEFI
jgi:DNA helicase-2/ATP-dependent DNA helicase PcrA